MQENRYDVIVQYFVCAYGLNDLYMLKLIKLYNLDMCSLLYVVQCSLLYVILIKLFKNDLKKSIASKNLPFLGYVYINKDLKEMQRKVNSRSMGNFIYFRLAIT